jgi:hypothetical protein
MTYVFLLLVTVAAAGDKIVPPESVTGLLKNCVARDPKGGLGPKQVCNPSFPLPLVSTEQFAQYQKKAGEISDKGIPLEKLGYYVGRWFEVAISNCRREFGEKLAKGGIGEQQVALAWADAVVFKKDIKEPTILLNTDPTGSTSGGLVVVLPDFEACGDPAKIAAQLKEVNRQWNALVRLAELPSDKQSELDRAFGDPTTVFQVVARANGCPGVEAYAHSRFIPDARKRAPPLASYRGKDPVYREAVGKTNDATRQALNTWAETTSRYNENQLKALEEKGITVDPYGITVRGRKIKVIS